MKHYKRPYFRNKGSATSKNFEVFLRNLTYIKKPSYWRFVESLKSVADVK